jgi:sodium/potassium-transporting ATPase subunit alpha
VSVSVNLVPILLLTSFSLLTIKGAPDILIERCTKFTSVDGITMPLDAGTRKTIDEMKNKWSSQGKRVILLAKKTLGQDEIKSASASTHFEAEIMRHARDGLTLVGLVGIVDPPRDEIPWVVQTLRGAGVRIFMVCYFRTSN